MAMRICVCIKVVPREAVQRRIDADALRLDRTGPSELDAIDLHTVEAALTLRDGSDAEVVAVSMGPASSAEGLRTALAMGVDRASLVADPLLEGSDLVATSRVLAAAVAHEEPDLVLFGAQSSDGGGAMLWAAVAERLRYPLLSGVRDIEVSEGRAMGVRIWSDRRVRLTAPLPCVVALSGAVNTPRYPSFRDVVAAKRKEIDIVGTSDLGIAAEECGTAGSRTRVLGLAPAPARRASGEIIEDEGNGAQWLFDTLTQRGLM